MSDAGSHEADESDPFADRNWEGPAGLNQVMDEFTVRLATANPVGKGGQRAL